MLTLRGRVSIGLCLGLIAVGYGGSFPVLSVLGVACILCLVWAAISVALSKPSLEVLRSINPPSARKGQDIHVMYRVQNKSRRRLGPLSFRDPLVRAESRERVSLRLRTTSIGGLEDHSSSQSFSIDKRGLWQLGPVELRTSDMLGLCARIQTFNETAEIVVAPKREVLTTMLPVHANDLMKHGVGIVQPDEPDGVRPYVPGDEPRMIHWRSSARSTELQVREFARSTTVTAVCLLIDDNPQTLDGEAFERLLELAASILGAAETNNDTWSLALRSHATKATSSRTAASKLLAQTELGSGQSSTTLDRRVLGLREARSEPTLIVVLSLDAHPSSSADLTISLHPAAVTQDALLAVDPHRDFARQWV